MQVAFFSRSLYPDPTAIGQLVTLLRSWSKTTACRSRGRLMERWFWGTGSVSDASYD